MFARRFADPTELVLALCEKCAERTRIDQITRTNYLIYKESGDQHWLGASHGSPLMKDFTNTPQRRQRERMVGRTYGESGTTPEPVTSIRRLVRAPRKSAAGLCLRM
jgi:hypothetical protein